MATKQQVIIKEPLWSIYDDARKKTWKETKTVRIVMATNIWHQSPLEKYMRADLQQYVGTVMNCHYESSNADIVWNPREAQQSQSGCVMNHLFLKVLQT